MREAAFCWRCGGPINRQYGVGTATTIINWAGYRTCLCGASSVLVESPTTQPPSSESGMDQ